MIIRGITAPNPGPFTLEGTQTWLLGDSAVVDPGPAVEAHVAAIAAAMPGLRAIFVTHRHADHAPAAVALKRATGAPIIAPAGVLPETDRIVGGGEQVDAGDVVLEVIATPGHTSEHVCYLTPSGDLFTGDMVLGAGTTAIFPPDGNMADYLSSLRTLRARMPGRIFPGHGPVREDAVALLDEYIEHRLDRERQIVDALRVAPAPVPGLRARIYTALDPRLEGAAEIQLAAHLIKLQSEGLVDEVGGVYRLVSAGV